MVFETYKIVQYEIIPLRSTSDHVSPSKNNSKNIRVEYNCTG